MPNSHPQRATETKSVLRHWLQFSLTGCLIATTILAVVMGRVASQAQRQAGLVQRVERREGSVIFQARRTMLTLAPSLARRLLGQEYFRQVVGINLREKSVSPELLSQIGRCETLRTLDLRNCGITDDLVLRLRRLRQLRWLDLSLNSLTNNSLDTITEFDQLLNLDLSQNRIDDRGIERLERLEQLISLSLAGTSIQDSGAQSVGRMHTLLNLDLSDTRVTNQGLAHLKPLYGLLRLRLDYRQGATGPVGSITDEGLSILSEMHSLTYVTLVNQAFTDTGLEVVGRLPRLRYLNVENDSPRFSQSTLRRLKSEHPQLTIHGWSTRNVN